MPVENGARQILSGRLVCQLRGDVVYYTKTVLKE